MHVRTGSANRKMKNKGGGAERGEKGEREEREREREGERMRNNGEL